MGSLSGASVISRIDPRDNSRLLSVSPMGMRKAAFSVVSKRLSIGLLLAVFGAAPMCAMPHKERHEVRHQIENLEKAWCTAILHGNVSAMDTLLADDYM